MKLTLDGIKEKQQWERANIILPEYNVRAVKKRTSENPEWVHFGAGNIFRGFIGSIAQKLLNSYFCQLIYQHLFPFQLNPLW